MLWEDMIMDKLRKRTQMVFLVVIMVFLSSVLIILLLPKELTVDAGGNNHYSIDIGDEIQFMGSASGGDSPYNWSWDFNDDGIIDSNQQNPKYLYIVSETTQFIVKLIVRDASGILKNDTAFVSIGLHLEPGDILFMNIKPQYVKLFNLGFNVHTAMFIGDDMFVETGDYRILKNAGGQIVDQYEFKLEENGVQISSKAWLKLVYENFSIGKPINVSLEQRQQAIGFALSQDEKEYQWGRIYWYANPNITDIENPFYSKYYFPDDEYVDSWYCSELVWAAYLQTGLNLDGTLDYDKPNPSPPPEGFYWVGVDDLQKAYITEFNLTDWGQW